MSTIKEISVLDLCKILNSIDGKQSMFASIFYQSDARLTKKDRQTKEPCPIDQGWWISEKVVNLNVNYENSVNRQRQKEGVDGKFEKENRTWGDQVNDGKNGSLIEYKGKYYLQAVPQSEQSRELVDNNGKNIDWLRDWDVFPKKSKPKKQGTEKEIPVRSFMLSRIKEIRLNGQRYKITG